MKLCDPSDESLVAGTKCVSKRILLPFFITKTKKEMGSIYLWEGACIIATGSQ
jgi:hypothetical protein